MLTRPGYAKKKKEKNRNPHRYTHRQCIKVCTVCMPPATENPLCGINQTDAACAGKAQGVEWLCRMLPYSGPSTDLFKDFFFLKMMVSTEAASDRLLPHFSRQQVPSFFTALSPIISLHLCGVVMMVMYQRTARDYSAGTGHCYRTLHGRI